MNISYHHSYKTHRKNFPRLVLTVGAAFGLCLPLRAYPLQNLTTNVVVMNGSDNDGNTFPGALVPFGMIQWSPDTLAGQRPGGYSYPDTQIAGFSLDHVSGAGCPYGEDFAFTPILGSVTVSPASNGGNGKTAFLSSFSHSNEIAVPGYYSVQFTNGIRTELTATTRAGIGRFTYPAGNTASMVVNAGSGIIGTANASVQINPNGQEICGWTSQSPFCGTVGTTTVYFDAVFDHAFATYGVWNGATLTTNGTNATGAQTGVYLSFSVPGGGVVLAKTAVSYVSVANARANLQAESPTLTSSAFDGIASAANNSWNGYLNKIQVSGGSAADIQIFYTMMYHALQAPSVVSDVNRQFIGFDNQIRSTSGYTKYEYFSGWDIYRNECQFIAMMDPARASDMAQSLVQDAHDGGAMPHWSVANEDTGVMIGDASTPIIAGMYAFGATNFDTASALAAMVRAATNPAIKALNGLYERDDERDFLNLGYIPEYQAMTVGWPAGSVGPVSMTLEYCSDDFALSRFAQSLGDTTNYALGMNRAQNWRNLYNAGSGYIQMRRSDGLWSPGFVADNQYYDNSWASEECSAAQITWMVPFNLGSLIAMMGGPPAASSRLDTFFTQLNAGQNSPYAYMGNEPCSEVPWIYNFVGQPYKCSSVVRQIMTQLYSTAPGGLPGNDDLGAMSSWYVLAALGLHPELPGDDVLVLNGPLFPQAVIHLTSGDVTITASGAGDNAPHIQSLTVNGQPSNSSWLRYRNIANGGTLAFTLGTSPNTNWASAVSSSNAPPSYTDGMTSPLAGTYFWGTGLESGETNISWTNTVDAAPYPAGGIANVGPIASGVTGPELGVRSEYSLGGSYGQSGNNDIMYSGTALGAASDYAFMKVFDLSSRNITISQGMHFSYWIFPQSHAINNLVTGNNSLYVALDIIFKDGTNLRDSGLTNQYGAGLNPTNQANVLALDTWNYVTVDLTPLAGKTVNRIDLGYNQPGGLGGYRGYVDDIGFTTPTLAPLPSVPTGLQAVGGYGLACLNWAVAAGATSYNVKRSTSSGAETTMANPATTNYTDKGLTSGITYYYAVSAVNLLGESGNSSEVNVTPVTPMTGSYESAVVTTHPLAYWPLNETNGPTAYDLVGGYNGTYVGGVTLANPGVPSLGFSSPSYSALFDGTSAYVDVPGGPFNLTNAITVVAWIKVPAISHFSGVLGHGDSSWRMSVNPFGDPAGNDGGDGGDATSPTSILGDNWHMLAYTCTGPTNVSGNGSFYVDGLPVASDTVTAVAANTMDVWIGGSPDYGTTRLMQGSIAHAAAFTNALSPAQVLTLYQAATNVPTIKLSIAPVGGGNQTLSWWRGTLLQSTNLAGPWTTNPVASPCTFTPTNSQMYFKVKVT